MSVFCSLCGGRVEPHDGSPIGEAGLRWDAEVRAVRTRAYIHGAYVTGLGFMSPGGELIASVEEGTSYRNAREQLETHQVRPRLGLFWCFPVHGICWDLLRVAIHPARDWPVALVAAHLFDLLVCNVRCSLLPLSARTPPLLPSPVALLLRCTSSVLARGCSSPCSANSCPRPLLTLDVVVQHPLG